MKFFNSKFFYALPIACSGMTLNYAHANLVVGQKLSEAEVASIADRKDIRLNGQSLKILSEQQSSGTHSTRNTTQLSTNKTFVADANGLVGLSQNAVMISNLPTTQIRAKNSKAINNAIAAKYFDHLNITSLQFRSLDEAIQAQRELSQLFPTAKVTVPIEFTEKKSR